MKVLFCIRRNYLKNIAGDSVQLMTTAKFLKKLGINVYINNGNIKNYEDFDIIHLFNLTKISETYEYFKIAKKNNKPIVITPIYWNLKKYYLYEKSKYNLQLWERNNILRKEILDGCNMVYPSSLMEMQLLQDDFGSNIPFTIIYNCLDTDVFNQQNKCKKQNYILSAARICPRKNQLELAEICNELGENLVLAGEANNKYYLEKCLRFKNVTHIGHMPIKELINQYKGAKLHILCSFVETPGLSSLEAGACGCNIISTSEGSTKEYFKDMALYCNPYDYNDIYNSVKNGLMINNQPKLKQHILDNFTAAKCLIPLYNSYLNFI